MWENLDIDMKQKNKLLITNFASLSEAFSQKNDEGGSGILNISPIINSKFQESAFQNAFQAVCEDISNTSYDASLVTMDNKKYLVGIKSFGISSGNQKIAQFKAVSSKNNWSRKFIEVQKNSEEIEEKEKLDKKNELLYYEIACEIAQIRNERIKSSVAQIRGFDVDEDRENIKSIYHVLMPSKKGEQPKIYVGEIDYSTIDIDSIRIIGSTTRNNLTNFKFTDGNHEYKYTHSDSQLLMNFDNKNIVVDTWDVSYIDDPFDFFEKLNVSDYKDDKKDKIVQTVSWMIAKRNGKIPESSGFNAFDGFSKLGEKEIKKRIHLIEIDFKQKISEKELKLIISELNEVSLKKYKTSKEKNVRKRKRKKLLENLSEINCIELTNRIKPLVSRSVNEVYIPIPDSKKFHLSYPNFFGEKIGTFLDENPKKLALPKSERIFILDFLASGTKIEAYINQDDGKAIQSINKQDILGKWLLREVFQLKEGELLTNDRLNDLEINGIRLSKFLDGRIGLEFIWIDEENPPSDLIGWLSNESKQKY